MVLQEQLYSKTMFNERADAVEQATAFQEELQQQRALADENQKQALEQQQQLKLRISTLMQECASLQAEVSSLKNDDIQFKEQRASTAAADSTLKDQNFLLLEQELEALRDEFRILQEQKQSDKNAYEELIADYEDAAERQSQAFLLLQKGQLSDAPADHSRSRQ
jgi:hypothetical protein